MFLPYCTESNDARCSVDFSSQASNWIKADGESATTGVCLRVDDGLYRVFPYENESLVPFEAAVRALNPAVGVKLRTAAVQAALNKT